MTILYIIIGIVGGIVGGMGMGGGTLLIPLLTILCGVEQHIAQCVNLIAFVPMSIVAIIIHIKNGLIRGEYFWQMALPAVLTSVSASMLVKHIKGEMLSMLFGIFLIALGLYQLITAIISLVKAKKAKKEKK